MKKLFGLLLLLPFFAGAQDSCSLKTTRDPYTKEIRFSTGFITVGNNKVSVEASAKEIDFFFMLDGTKCFDDQSQLVVNFEGARIKQSYRSSGTMNCEGYFHINFRNTPAPSFSLKKLGSLKVTSFIFKKGTEETVVMLTADQRMVFQKAVNCIIAQAPGLIH